MNPTPFSLEELKIALESKSHFVIDLRTLDEWKELHLLGAHHIPLDQLPQFLLKLKKERLPILCHCAHGVRAERGAKWLLSQGVKASFVKGDIECWAEKGLPVV